MTDVPLLLADGAQEPLPHIFHDFGYANADFTETPPTRRLFRHLASYSRGCRFMRVHNIFSLHGDGDRYLREGQSYGNPPGEAGDHDRVFRRAPDGSLVTDWSLVDQVYDRFLAHGFRPIVECCFVPSCLQDWDVPTGERSKHGRSHVPRDVRDWQTCVRLFVEHCRDRYGLAEIRQWWWEIYNEPDAVWHWVERPERFHALYDHFAAAVKAVDAELIVGGPAVKQDETAQRFFTDFLQHCHDGPNHATGVLGAPLDFISVHCKAGIPQAFSPDLNEMFSALARFRTIITEHFPGFAATPFVNDESDIVWAGDSGVDQAQWLNFRNRTYFPAIVVKMVDRYLRELLDAGVPLTGVDSDNCHVQWEQRLFSGNRCQLTPLAPYPCTDLLRKPVFNAYVMLARLRPRRWRISCNHADHGRCLGALVSGDEEGLAILAWHAEDGLDDECDPRSLEIAIPEPGIVGDCQLVVYRLDRQHGSSYDRWQAQGRPRPPSPSQIAELREAERLRPEAAPQTIRLDGAFNHRLTLPMHGLALLLVVPTSDRRPAAPDWHEPEVEADIHGQPQVLLVWTPEPAADLSHYRIWRRCGDAEPACVLDDPGLNTALWIDATVKPGGYEYAVATVTLAGVEGERSEWLPITVR